MVGGLDSESTVLGLISGLGDRRVYVVSLDKTIYCLSALILPCRKLEVLFALTFKNPV